MPEGRTYAVEVAYDSGWHGWGVLDARIKQVARGLHLGSGTDLEDGYRDLSFQYATKRGAQHSVARLRKAFRGYRLRVSSRDL